VIDREENLSELIGRLRNAEWVAIDTEADSLHAYPEKLCLLQISIQGADELVDPLARLDLTSLMAALASRELVLHGSDYDLRLLHRASGFVPLSIFDTMIAARLCGVPEFGLASLAQKYLGLTLEKGAQKADWARRPLTPRMEEYARNDTRHLKALSDLLRAALEEKGRIEWLRETCARLVVEASTARDGKESRERWRISGCNRLERRALAVLREVWKWREEAAIGLNRPPFFVLSHDSLLALSEAASRGQPVEPLVPGRFPPHRRAALLLAIERGRRVPPAELPELPRFERRRVTEAEKKRFAELKKKRDTVAENLALDPTLIASKGDLLQLARDSVPPPGLLLNWQHNLLFA
jgi:ribonuclease D